MKIIYLHQYFNTPEDSGGTRSYEMARRLVAQGNSVDIVTSKRSGNSFRGWKKTEEAGINIHWIYIPYSNSMSFSKRIVAFLKFSLRATLKSISLKGDIIFATSTPLTIAIPAIISSKMNKLPMIFEVRDLWPELPIAAGVLTGKVPIALAKWLERTAYLNSEQIVALSPGIKQGVIEKGYPSDKVHVIPNSADIELFSRDQSLGKIFRKQFHWLQDRPLIVYTGTIGMINGVEYLVKVAAVVYELDPDIRFLVVGEGKKESYVRSVAQELGVFRKNFYMMGPLPKTEIPDVLSAADIATSLFIDLPEMWTNSANKFFDALASGTPIAINYQGWQAELIQKYDAGLILDVNNAEKSARKLVDKVRNDSWLKHTGLNAKKMARERFSRNDLAKYLECVLLSSVE